MFALFTDNFPQCAIIDWLLPMGEWTTVDADHRMMTGSH